MLQNFYVDPDIEKAETLPRVFYTNTAVFEGIKEKVFYRSWQWIGDLNMLSASTNVCPKMVLQGFLNEPVVLTRDANHNLNCLSNVCTHRANTVVNAPGSEKKLVCKYHGRRFKLDGSFEYMPEFKETKNFPRACDNLHQFPLRQWGPFLFAGFHPKFDFQQVINVMNERIGFLPLNEFVLDPERSKEYEVNAHWALYCDNYLEGFHIPFVHADLNEVLDYGDYDTLVFDYLNLQIGYAGDTDEVFQLPEGHVDYGKKIAAYYFWVFPNMMFNFYPWGLSVNLVQPKEKSKTVVSFFSYVYDPSKLGKGAGSILDKVELEDEEVVEGVQSGLNSAFYHSGRFSPKREKGVHHFHRLLADFISD